MKNIYGNDSLKATLSCMVRSGKTAHTVLFYGEKGTERRFRPVKTLRRASPAEAAIPAAILKKDFILI